MIKTSIATVSISGTLEEKLRAIASAGFNGVEIFENDLLASSLTPKAIGEMARDLGLAICLFQPFRDFEGMPDALRTGVFERAERKFDLMQQLGTGLMLVCSNCSPHALGDRNRIIDDFSEMGERAAKRALRVGYEALAWGKHVSDHRDVWGIVRDVDHPNIGMILDSFHSLVRKIPSTSIAEIDPAKLFFVQVADAPNLEMDFRSHARHFRNMPGQGDFPLIDFARAVHTIGYTGYWSLEIFNDHFRAGSAPGVALDGYRSLVAMADQITPLLPPPVPVTGVTFIEFAVDAEEGVGLEAILAALGFVAAGRHRSKDVTRWQQGGVNLILNREQGGFAHSFELFHGAAVCAIGLSVVGVDAALERAKGLSIQQFSQSVGPGEMLIPSVRGVGGSLLYFIEAGTEEKVWAQEFIPVESDLSCCDIGIEKIDHIAQTTRVEEFLGWLLYYLTLFDVQKTAQVEIADTLGLVQSQAVESPNQAMRITLNGSLGQNTLSSRFVQNYIGAGVQHIAFRTSDIFEAAKAARANGLDMLDIPRNYYDDLEARFGLDQTFIDKMATSGILYDRDEETEYFQFYSRAFAKRLFFEVVERRGYRAYGAANAAIRLTAQARFRDDIVG
jgi:4-hydroxyphenylpyruvate dioxygenase